MLQDCILRRCLCGPSCGSIWQLARKKKPASSTSTKTAQWSMRPSMESISQRSRHVTADRCCTSSRSLRRGTLTVAPSDLPAAPRVTPFLPSMCSWASQLPTRPNAADPGVSVHQRDDIRRHRLSAPAARAVKHSAAKRPDFPKPLRPSVRAASERATAQLPPFLGVPPCR